jgi:hypothetical protein
MNTNLDYTSYVTGGFRINSAAIGIGMAIACVFLFIFTPQEKENLN